MEREIESPLKKNAIYLRQDLLCQVCFDLRLVYIIMLLRPHRLSQRYLYRQSERSLSRASNKEAVIGQRK